MEVRVPVIAGGVEGIVHTLPRGALHLLKEDADVPPFIGDQRSASETLGDRGQQFVGAPAGACDVNDDRGQRHLQPIVGPCTNPCHNPQHPSSAQRRPARGRSAPSTTSSRLVPKSCRMTIAALRPGPPVIDPPGWVVPLVW